MNYSHTMYKLWLRYVEKLTVETLLDCYMHSVAAHYNEDTNDDDGDIASGHQRFSIWSKGTVYTFRGPEWARMLSIHEDNQLSLHIPPTVLSDFEKLVNL